MLNTCILTHLGVKAVNQISILNPEELEVLEGRTSHCKAEARLWVSRALVLVLGEMHLLQFLLWAGRPEGHRADPQEGQPLAGETCTHTCALRDGKTHKD